MATTTWEQKAGMISPTDADNIEDYAEQAEASKDAAAASEAAAAASAAAAAASELDAESAEANAATSAAAASGSASSAASSATAAASSATSASSSETAAAASETGAATSATNAATSATSASGSASSASTDASAASTSATASAASASAASASETAAATSETAAAASETAAATSETNAATSASSASASEAAATTSATAASGSATSAATSATAAATSATNAATSETNADTSETNAAASEAAAASSAAAASTSAAEAAASAASIDTDSIDINGGTIDGTAIGGTTPAAGSFTTGSFTGDVSFGDNDKAIFGAGSDLQIYHDGSHSYVTDQGTGNLRIQGSDITLQDASGNGFISMIDGGTGGTVYLKHSGANVLSTTSTGVDVTGQLQADSGQFDGNVNIDGTVTADGLTLANNTYVRQNDAAASLPRILGINSGNVTYVGPIDPYAGGSVFYGVSANVTSHKFFAATDERLRIASNGDISFFEDTGTTPKFFWDASAEALGIGTTPNAGYALTVQGGDIRLYDGSGGSFADIKHSGNTMTIGTSVGAGGTLVFNTNAAVERMRIDSSGNVGIGTGSPTEKLDVDGTVKATAFEGDGSSLTNLPAPSGVMSATNPIITSGTITEDIYSLGGTSATLEPDNGSIQTHTLSGNTTYSDGFSAGQAITLMIDDGAARTVTWPTMTWVNGGGSAPTLATTGYTTVALWKVGSTLYGALVGDGS